MVRFGGWVVRAGRCFADFFHHGFRDGWKCAGLEGAVVAAKAGSDLVGGGDTFERLTPSVAGETADFVGALDGECIHAVSGFAFEQRTKHWLDFRGEDE
jgi:hypothetical protein